jgi:hypothetical protein
MINQNQDPAIYGGRKDAELDPFSRYDTGGFLRLGMVKGMASEIKKATISEQIRRPFFEVCDGHDEYTFIWHHLIKLKAHLQNVQQRITVQMSSDEILIEGIGLEPVYRGLQEQTVARISRSIELVEGLWIESITVTDPNAD